MISKVKQHREILGLSQEQLAKMADVGRSTISDAEKIDGNPTINTALKISEALHVKIEKLYFLTDDDRKSMDLTGENSPS